MDTDFLSSVDRFYCSIWSFWFMRR